MEGLCLASLHCYQTNPHRLRFLRKIETQLNGQIPTDFLFHFEMPVNIVHKVLFFICHKKYIVLTGYETLLLDHWKICNCVIRFPITRLRFFIKNDPFF